MSQFHNSHIIAVALGATIGVIGAAGLFIYQKIMEHREREQMMDNLESVNKRVSELQVALDNIKTQQEQQRTKKGKNRKRMTSVNSFYSVAETDIDADTISVTETDIDDEFYDCSDEEGVTDGQIDNEPTELMELSRQLTALDEKIEREALHEEVLCDLRSLATRHDNNIEVIWRLARAYFKNANNLSDTKHQDTLLLEGMQICESLLEVEHADLHKWYAMLVGLRTEYLPLKEKLQAGKRFEKHVRLSLKLRPNDATLNHMLGRFQYTVSGLTWIEKKVCETLFGEAPTSTYKEAIEHLQKSEDNATEPDIENKYFLAKSYLKIKSYREGVNILNELKNLSPSNKKQEEMQSEATRLITMYSNNC